MLENASCQWGNFSTHITLLTVSPSKFNHKICQYFMRSINKKCCNLPGFYMWLIVLHECRPKPSIILCKYFQFPLCWSCLLLDNLLFSTLFINIHSINFLFIKALLINTTFIDLLRSAPGGANKWTYVIGITANGISMSLEHYCYLLMIYYSSWGHFCVFCV